MKSLRILVTMLVVLFTTSCSDDENMETNVEALSTEEAIEITEYALAQESAGLVETVSEYAKVYEEEISVDIQCNQTIVDSYNFTFNGNMVKTDYIYNWQYTLICNNASVAESASFYSNGSGLSSTQRIESSDSTSLSASISGLQPLSSTMVFNGTFSREGSRQITTDQNSKSLIIDFDVDLTDLTISKSDLTVASGSGSFTLSGTTNGEGFLYEGSITFNEDNTATVVINGTEYIIEL